MKRKLLAALGGVAMAAGIAQTPALGATGKDSALSPFVAEYKLSKGFLPLGQARFTLYATGNHCYRYHYRAEATGVVGIFRNDIITETSDFCVVNGQFRSQSDRFVHTGDGKDDNFALRFDWQNMTVSDGHGHTRKLPPHAMDRQTMQLWLRQKLADAGTHLPSRAFPVTIVDQDHTTTYQVKLESRKQVTVGAGTFDTVVLDRVDAKDKRVRFWLAPKLAYLPVKVEQSKKGSSMPFTLELTKLPESPTAAGNPSS